jgi:hypothetical protein
MLDQRAPIRVPIPCGPVNNGLLLGLSPAPQLPFHVQRDALQQLNSSQPLIPHNLRPGVKRLEQDIGMFCLMHGLSNDILERFREHTYTGTQAFRHISVED